MILKLRNWLLVKLAGKSVVAINLTIKNGGVYLEAPHFNRSLFVNVSVHGAAAGLHGDLGK